MTFMKNFVVSILCTAMPLLAHADQYRESNSEAMSTLRFLNEVEANCGKCDTQKRNVVRRYVLNALAALAAFVASVDFQVRTGQRVGQVLLVLQV